MSDSGTFRTFDGLDLFYQSWQNDSKIKAIFVIVHGFGEHCGRYMNVVNHLSPLGYAIYSFDMRGYGQSPGKRGYINDWKEYREDAKTFIKFVKEKIPDKPLFLFGHSLGGLVVLEYVLHNAEGLKAVIVSAPLLSRLAVSPILAFIARVFSRFFPGFSMDSKLDLTAISRDQDIIKASIKDPLTHSKGTARLGTEIEKARDWTHKHAGDISLPLLIIQGQADRIAPVAGARTFFENVTYKDKAIFEYEGGYHELHNDIIYKKVLTDVQKWLEKHM